MKKKVVLLGDSIRLIGYGDAVAKALSADFDVWQPAENCRFAKHTFRGTYDWRANLEGSDIIHWNNGLWDVYRGVDGEVFTPIDQYVAEMLRLAKVLKTKAKTIIFATTTPVRAENTGMDNSDIQAYNEALVPHLKEMGIVINDLHTTVKADIPHYICDDTTHLSEAGIALCAKQVAQIIRQEAEKL